MTSSQDSATQVDGQRLTGMVKWFNNKAGFGFITVSGSGEFAGKDIFVHFSAIRAKLYKYLVQGEYVDFTLMKSDNDKHEYTAHDIAGVMGGPIMCETRRVNISPDESGRRPYRPREQGDAPTEGGDFQEVESNRRRPANKNLRAGANRKPRAVAVESS